MFKAQLSKITHSSIQNTPFHLNANTHLFNNLLPSKSSPPPRVLVGRNSRPNQTIKAKKLRPTFSKTQKRKQKSSYHNIIAANCAAKFVALFASKNPTSIFWAFACMHACVIFPPPLFDVQKTEHEFKKGDVIMVLLKTVPSLSSHSSALRCRPDMSMDQYYHRYKVGSFCVVVLFHF